VRALAPEEITPVANNLMAIGRVVKRMGKRAMHRRRRPTRPPTRNVQRTPRVRKIRISRSRYMMPCQRRKGAAARATFPATSNIREQGENMLLPADDTRHTSLTSNESPPPGGSPFLITPA